MLRFDILTLFPNMFSSPIEESILKRAQEKELIEIRVINIRDFTSDKHSVTDDSPFGGGRGMVMKPEPIIRGVEMTKSSVGESKVILMTPQGRRLDQGFVSELSKQSHLIIICGRYEGVDERVREYVDQEISIGDYILSGGEPAAIVLVDAITRLVPGVLGNPKSAEEESFCNCLLEYPQYTRPREYRGRRVPEVLLSGNHEQINIWRHTQSLRRTLKRRPSLLEEADLSYDDLKILSEIREELK